MQKQQTILVTGSAGFIGSNFVKQFKEQFPQSQIIGIDNFYSGKRQVVESAKKSKVYEKFYEGSITDEKLVDKIFKTHRPDYVFHFAAIPRVAFCNEHPALTTHANIYGTVLLLEKSRDYKVTRFIYSSSSSIYGGAKKLPTSEKDNPPAPIAPYGLEKYVGEPFCQVFSSLFGLDTVCLRYFNVFGPGQYGDSAYSTVISAWLENLYFPHATKSYLEGDGTQSRDFCYVDNVVQANIRGMLSKGKLGGVAVNVGHGERTNLKEIKKLIEQLTGKKLDLEMRPPRLGDVKHTLADISKAKKVLGYKPTINFETGLERTVAWFEGRSK